MALPATPPTGPVVLSDASAVRALAHPARLVVIDALYNGQVLTATQCAALAGTTPSAMSYHLRSLEKHGLVMRAEASDGRERPWMRAGESLSIDLKGAPGAGSTLAAAELLVRNSLKMDSERLLAAMSKDSAADQPGLWSGTTRYTRETLVLTAAEARELGAAIDKLTLPFTSHARQQRASDSTTNFSFSVVLSREITED